LRTDLHNWIPLTVSEIHEVFFKLPIQWCIAGGWALDLHYGSQTREHSDIDVIITRRDQLTVFDCLSPDWILYRAEQGKLTLWNGEYLEKTNDIWVCKNNMSPWAFQLMIVDTENDYWVYKRNKAIRRPIDELFLMTNDGIPYLRPEIQLLHKGGSSEIREKDLADLKTMLPLFLPQEKEWLKSCLAIQFPQGHDWLQFL
jgi:Aminoglycoside-2''''-adenylyltransferase.